MLQGQRSQALEYWSDLPPSARLLWLTWKTPDERAVFFPNSTYPEGQNVLVAVACVLELVRRCRFRYRFRYRVHHR